MGIVEKKMETAITGRIGFREGPYRRSPRSLASSGFVVAACRTFFKDVLEGCPTD